MAKSPIGGHALGRRPADSFSLGNGRWPSCATISRACFHPKRGEAQAREVKRLIGVLKEAAPELAQSRGPALDELADASIAAEKAWRDSITAGAQAFALERIARTELIEQMQKNEGALTVLYPGQRRRVRSFFRPAHRRGAAPETGEPETSADEGE